MTAIRRLIAAHPSMVAWVFVAGLLLRGLVPVGFMPERERDGQIVVSICDGHGSLRRQVIQFHREGEQRERGTEGARHDMAPCAFASLALALLAGGEQPPLRAILPFSSQPTCAALEAQRGIRHHRILPPACGPPLQAAWRA